MSTKLSTRQTAEWADNLNYLNKDSIPSEKVLNDTINGPVMKYAIEKFKDIGTIKHENGISLYQCQEYFHRVGGPIPNQENKNVGMKPDGGIIILTKNGIDIPILITEDKRQGTNDQRLVENKEKQSLGNAIERAAKNIRGAGMVFAGQNIFPYVMFCSGCDFHSSETIRKRIDMMNMGVSPHSIEINKIISSEETDKLNQIVNNININKLNGTDIASIFIKSHKWDELPHGSSNWTSIEIEKICCKVIDLVYFEIN